MATLEVLKTQLHKGTARLASCKPQSCPGGEAGPRPTHAFFQTSHIPPSWRRLGKPHAHQDYKDSVSRCREKISWS